MKKLSAVVTLCSFLDSYLDFLSAQPASQAYSEYRQQQL